MKADHCPNHFGVHWPFGGKIKIALKEIIKGFVSGFAIKAVTFYRFTVTLQH